MRWLVAGVSVLLALAGYWKYKVHEKTEYLMELSRPFYAACQTSSGCVISPEGWSKVYRLDDTSYYYKDSMEYTASKDNFGIRWHIGTDVFLVAKGGRGKEVSVERIVE
ncbi:MAG TPA: hypothetical protein VNC62_11255 [Burkholderiales bacterium]|nr:hypothetical protein [Burkholderiales bacterium]